MFEELCDEWSQDDFYINAITATQLFQASETYKVESIVAKFSRSNTLVEIMPSGFARLMTNQYKYNFFHCFTSMLEKLSQIEIGDFTGYMHIGNRNSA